MKTNPDWFSEWPEDIRLLLLQNYQRIFVSIALSKKFNDADANDIAQSTIQEMGRCSSRYMPVTAADLWSLASSFVRHAIQDKRKSNGRIKNRALSLDDDAGIAIRMEHEIADVLEVRETLANAEAAMFGDGQRLTPVKKGARLVVFHLDSPRKVAALLGVSEGAINCEVCKIRKKLRDIAESERRAL